MAGASSRVQRIYRTEKATGAMEHATRAERRKRPARWNTLRVQNGENFRSDETHCVCDWQEEA